MKRLLIISNNVLSATSNNGKTLYSFVQGMNNVEVSQLYLSGEIPRLETYRYFRITDKDIIRGIFRSKKRGRIVDAEKTKDAIDDFSIKKRVGRNIYTLIARDLLWHKKWNSNSLNEWLDSIHPDAIFFVAGDALFAYEICDYIQGKYNSRLTVYVTDDYIMPRKGERGLSFIRRNIIREAMRQILKKATCFYTISNVMRDAYRKEFGMDSLLAVNMSDDLKDDKYKKTESEVIFTYAGSFYYRRAEVLGRLARLIWKYNCNHPECKAKLMLYSNKEPSDEIKREICVFGASEYGGSLNAIQLKKRLNTSDILVFVESFDPEQIEKVKFSLSTKIPEYMSIEKPILAIGPKGIGSMDYLADIAICVHDWATLENAVEALLSNLETNLKYGVKARKKYLIKHDSKKLQAAFYENVLGKEV